MLKASRFLTILVWLLRASVNKNFDDILILAATGHILRGVVDPKMVKIQYLPPLPPPTALETGGLQSIFLVSKRGSYISNFTALGQMLTAPEQFKALPGVSYPQRPR
jgi:hypothetical protein